MSLVLHQVRHIFCLLYVAVDQIRRLGGGVTVDPIPDYVLSVFGVRKGGDAGKTRLLGDEGASKATVGGLGDEGAANETLDCLSGVDERLRSTLLPFQREAVR